MKRLLLLFCFSPFFSNAQTYIQVQDSMPGVSLRGLSAVDDEVAWASGTKGYVARTRTGGNKWEWRQVKGYETFDFRDIEAFDSLRAVIINAGSPAVVLQTKDGGKTWTERYRNDKKEMFLDGMDWWDDARGIIFGDPIDGRMFMMSTNDSGKTWQPLPAANCPKVDEGEAAFAASGTSIRAFGAEGLVLATGGKRSRLWTFRDKSPLIDSPAECPILQGKTSTGIFSLAFRSYLHGVAVGGDYKADTLTTGNCFYTRDGGTNWWRPKAPPSGYRSCVEYIGKKDLVAVGATGVDVSRDDGKRWKNVSRRGFNVVRKAKDGSAVFVAGDGGRVGRLW